MKVVRLMMMWTDRLVSPAVVLVETRATRRVMIPPMMAVSTVMITAFFVIDMISILAETTSVVMTMSVAATVLVFWLWSALHDSWRRAIDVGEKFMKELHGIQGLKIWGFCGDRLLFVRWSYMRGVKPQP